MNEQHIDQATRIRKGENLDVEALKNYLSEHFKKPIHEIVIKQFPGGFSNLTYLVVADGAEYVLRRPPFGAKIKTAHDMGREFKVLSLLQDHYPHIPQPVVHCEEENVIGAPFYLMTRAKGIILRSPNAMKIKPDQETMRRLSEMVVNNLSDLHAIDIQATGLVNMGKPEGYVKRQVEGWTRRYFKAKTDEILELEEMAQWLDKQQPTEYAASFIHNDYKYDNLVLNPDGLKDIVAVLDWEMATVGDPLMDLGTTLAYWAEIKDPDLLKMFNPSWLPGNLTRQGIVEHYGLRSGRNMAHMLFYYIFGVFKISVICQQIYARFKKGYTQDPRFGQLIHVIKALAKQGVKSLEKGRML